MTRFWLPLLFILGLTFAASASSDIVGSFGSAGGFIGFSGRFPIVGSIGQGTTPPPTDCTTGVIDASLGCPLPMLGM